MGLGTMRALAFFFVALAFFVFFVCVLFFLVGDFYYIFYESQPS